MEITQNWILMAVIAPTFWAIICVLDSCLIGSKIYRVPSDGAIVSCLFGLAPVFLALSSGSSDFADVMVRKEIPLLAIMAGLAFALHLFFYFRILHWLNDVSGAETFISLSVIVVPLFAWLLLGERLPGHFYLAFFIAASGVVLQCFPVVRNFGLTLLVNMVVTTTAVSLSMVLQSSALETHGFIISTVFFNLTVFCVALVVILISSSIRQRVTEIFRHYFVIIFTGEVLGVLAVLSSHRATQHGPSVSIVALIECLLPLIIIALSSTLIIINRYWPLLSSQHQSTLALQLQGMPMKMGALVTMVISLTILMI